MCLINISRSFDGKLFYICQYVKDKFDGTKLDEKGLVLVKDERLQKNEVII